MQTSEQYYQSKVTALATWPERLQFMIEWFNSEAILRTAMHEAAHAVIYTRMKVSVRIATIDPAKMPDALDCAGIITGQVRTCKASLICDMIGAFAPIAYETEMYRRPLDRSHFKLDGKCIRADAASITAVRERSRVVQKYLEELENTNIVRICSHEAAHAVVYIKLNSGFVTATVDPINLTQNYDFPSLVTGTVRACDASPFDHMVAGFAGIAYESLRNHPRAKFQFSGDYRLIRAHAALLAAQHLPAHRPGDVEWNRYVFRAMISARRAARNLVESPYAAQQIIAVGCVLANEGTLSGRQIEEVMKYVAGLVGRRFRARMMRIQETYDDQVWPWQIPEDTTNAL